MGDTEQRRQPHHTQFLTHGNCGIISVCSTAKFVVICYIGIENEYRIPKEKGYLLGKTEVDGTLKLSKL